MATDWASEQAKRVGKKINDLRGKRSAQWLSDRTDQLGMRVARTTISELETGRRKHVTVAELSVLAAALDTAPVALLYPGPYDAPVDVLPEVRVTELDAVQWFSGVRTIAYARDLYADEETAEAARRLILGDGSSLENAMQNLRLLQRWRDLDDARSAKLRGLRELMRAKDDLKARKAAGDSIRHSEELIEILEGELLDGR
ncbi:DNA-binding protein [Tsukamurella spumae]|uniref:DNA-binding protein n=1 Tax=Tsukamurella spumae TaxID=44753 RepID=A0A846WYS5_9ACTN|nr:DNA-binding protein [Tsukamurella spumae]NKY17516.1 DNA-binding protein [Tsukamurella spumae]